MDDQYEIKTLIRYLLMALAALAVWTVTSGIGALLVTLFVVWSVIRNRPVEMLFWVIFMTFSSAGNRNFFVANVFSVTTMRATLMLLTLMLAAKIFGGGREARLMTPFWGVMAYVGWECIISVQGFSPIVSYLKLILFISVFLAMFGVANTVNRSMRVNATLLRSAILAIISMVIIGSVLIIPFPALSMLRGEEATELIKAGEAVSLFKGMTSHSQVMGPMAAIMGTFLLADMAFSIRRWDKLYILLLLICPVLIYKSSSRTGMGTFVAGAGMVLFLVMRAKGLGQSWKGKLLMAANVTTVCCMIAVFVIPSLRERVVGFALKTSENARQEAVSFENVVSSRQGLMDEAMRNFKDKPIQGNGFQVSAEMQHQKRTSFVNYLSASIEKGVWIYAILEEGGIVGFLLFVGWLVVLFYLLIQRHAYIGASVFFTFIVANLGEFCLFSMSYIGGIYWTLTFAAICLDVQRMKASSMPVFFVPIEQVREEVGIDLWTKRLG